MIRLILITTTLTTLLSDVVIDLSKAKLDEESGNYCVVQKVMEGFNYLINSLIKCLNEGLFSILDCGPLPSKLDSSFYQIQIN